MPILDGTRVPTIAPSSTRQPSSTRTGGMTFSRSEVGKGSVMQKMDGSSSRPSQASSSSRQDSRVPTQSSSSRLDPRVPNSSSTRRPPTQAGPSSGRATSSHPSAYDEQMGRRQTKIATLVPNERREQEKWAHPRLQTKVGNCMAGLAWVRTENCNGLTGCRYRGKSHFVTDEMLATGDQRSFYRDPRGSRYLPPVWRGPYTQEEEAWMYGLTLAQYKHYLAQGKAKNEDEFRKGNDPYAGTL